MTGDREQRRNESGRQAKDLQLQKVSVLRFGARILAMVACCSELKRGFSNLFLFPQAVNHSLETWQVCY